MNRVRALPVITFFLLIWSALIVFSPPNHAQQQNFGTPGFVTLTYNASGTTYLNGNINAVVTATHSTSTTFQPNNLVNGGYYTVEIKQDATGGGTTFTLGTTGSCSAWNVLTGSGGATTITLSTGASLTDVLTFLYDGSKCVANFRNN